jgi:chromosome segregation ATPase
VYRTAKELPMGSAGISVDEFQALEQKVLQTVELIKREREAKAAAVEAHAKVETELMSARADLEAAQRLLAERNEEVSTLRQELASASEAQSEVETLHREREAVRLRVEKMLASIEEIA